MINYIKFFRRIYYATFLISSVAFSQVTKETVMEFYSTAKQSNDLEFSYAKSKIPSSIKRKLKKSLSGFKLIGNDEKFNASKPDAQLLFIIKKGDYYTIVFKRGGRALSQYFVFCEIKNKKLLAFQIYDILGYVKSQDDFILSITEGKFRQANF